MTTATSLAIGKKYVTELAGLTYCSEISGHDWTVAALVEFVLVDDGGEIVPEIIAVHLDEMVLDPHGAYEEEARKRFHEDWKAGTVQVMGREGA